MNFLVEIREGLGISWAALRANKMRSVLATLGIVIGILTVTLMGAAINGLNQAFALLHSCRRAGAFSQITCEPVTQLNAAPSHASSLL